jgi:hypothetical protein
LKRLRELEAENHKLKQMYADLNLEHQVIKDVVEKKTVKPSERRDQREVWFERAPVVLCGRPQSDRLSLYTQITGPQPDQSTTAGTG